MIGIAGDKDAERAIADEVSEFAGVSVQFIRRKNGHPFALVTFNNQSRKVTYSTSVSDWRAAKGARTVVRRVLRELGAEPCRAKERRQ